MAFGAAEASWNLGILRSFGVGAQTVHNGRGLGAGGLYILLIPREPDNRCSKWS